MTQDARAFNWDSIPVKTGSTADPAAGAQLAAITVAAGKRMILYSMEATIVADATVATRIFFAYIRINGADTTYASLGGLNITASQTKLQSFMANSLVITAGTQYGMHIPLMELPAGATILMYAVALQAGDNIGAMTYTYKEAPA